MARVEVVNESEATNEGVKISSLIPLLQLLPAWKSDDGQLVLRGEITSENAKPFAEYAGQVTEFIYPDTSSSNSNITISPDVYIRLSLRLAPPLLPSLHTVQLHSVSSRMHYLPLLFSPSLSSLEISNIEPDAIHLVNSFLANLPCEAPGIKELTLTGPYQLLASTLNPISELKELEALNLDDIAFIDDIALLEQLSTLPLLKSLKVIVRTPGRTSSPPSEPAQGTGFPKLESLRITGSIRLVYDLVNLVSSKELQRLQMTVIPSQADPTEEQARLLQLRRFQGRVKRLRHKREVLVEARVRVAADKRASEMATAIHDSQERIRYLKTRISGGIMSIKGDESALEHLMKAGKERRINERLKEIMRDNGESQINRDAARKELEENLPLDDGSKAVNCAKKALEKTKAHVQDLKAELSEAKASHKALVASLDAPCSVEVTASTDIEDIDLKLSKPAPKPSITEDQVVQRTLDLTLEIVVARWRESLHELMFSIDNDKQSSSSLIKPPPEVYSLLDGFTERFRHLYTIADFCPLLESLAIKLDTSRLPILPDSSGIMYSLLHGLHTLNVNSTVGIHSTKDTTRLARFINALFPDLEVLSAPTQGPVSEMWADVCDQVKLFQLIRQDNECRR